VLQSRMGVVSHPHMAADVAVGHRGNFRRAGRAHVDSEGGERPGGMPVSGRRESTPALPRAAVVAKLRNMPWLLEFKCAGPQRNRGALLAPSPLPAPSIWKRPNLDWAVSAQRRKGEGVLLRRPKVTGQYPVNQPGNGEAPSSFPCSRA
jgi:hypothetical protein